MSWMVSSSRMWWYCCWDGPGIGDLAIMSLGSDRFRDVSNRGLDVATGRIVPVPPEALSGEPMAPPDPFNNKLSLSLRRGRGLAGSIDGTGILGAERDGLVAKGSAPLENFRTSEGLSSRLLGWPWPLWVELDSFQLRRWIEGLAFPALAPPLPFSAWWWPLVTIMPYVNGLLSSRAW